MKVCVGCQSKDIEYDTTMGNTVCNACGMVLEENGIVSEVQFSDTVSGMSVLQGTFYPEKGRQTTKTLYGTRRFFQSDSREWTISTAKSRIQSLAYAVQLNDHHVNAAHRWYILALQHNFTRGRKSQNIAAACLYIVCRQEKTSHMLLDFSDVLQTNVYDLGTMYLKLCRLLNLDIPVIDPSLYISRFASKLEFGDKTQMVANTALRLVSRMKRDWIMTGRRPSGICGACLLISSRLYNFNRTQKDIIRIVRVCDVTLRKRLNEFAETPSSKLTPEEFHGIWLEQEQDPPSYSTSNKNSDKLEDFVDMSDDETPLDLEKEISELIRNTTALLPGSEEFEEPRVEKHEYSEDSEEDVDLEKELQTFDEELSQMLLTEDESKLKEMLWMEANKDYLAEKDLKEQQKNKDPDPKPRRKRQSDKDQMPRKKTIENAKEALQNSKKLSKKFNYDILNNLLS